MWLPRPRDVDRLGIDGIRPRICAEGCMGNALALSQYEQGGYLGLPILSSAVFSTRDHRGAGCALPRPVPHSRMPLASRIEHVF